MKNQILDITKKVFHNHLTAEFATTLIMDLCGMENAYEDICLGVNQMIEPERLEGLGYERHEWTSKNSPKDGFDNMKHVMYSKNLSDGFAINVVYFYTADIPDSFILKKHYAELESSCGESLSLPLNVDHIERVYNLLKIGLWFK